MRALFGEDLSALRAEIEAHAARSVAFFLAACGPGAPPPPASGTASEAAPPADHGAVVG
jgi:hypothetical protein